MCYYYGSQEVLVSDRCVESQIQILKSNNSQQQVKQSSEAKVVKDRGAK